MEPRRSSTMGTEILVIMKIVKILTGVVFLLLLMQGFSYLNLMVSDKYETQPEGLTELTPEVKEQAANRATEIQEKKGRVKIYSLILLSVLVCLIIVWSKNTTKEEKPIIKESKE
ncbi:hypothetical protein JCM21142_93958 [Saccharicrinis fermentans DSM 9555 = JCM 21142]|uniref:Uncharacterized protein n=2 Tax=Saccharicrinis fermentans TaxID=982 RepID=W7YL30_9BACT|nr:hypothetical protein JCM21142_93958 [Saccharicrinis fermentans DSM 9555 = JCM 21142]